MRRARNALLNCVAVVATVVLGVASAHADPDVDDVAPALPMFTPTPNNWQPKFPFPFQYSRDKVTDAEINAEREMCQWYNAQYDTLITQIDNFDVDIAQANGDYRADSNPELTAAMAANIDRAVDFLAPRAQLMTVSQDNEGDLYFPLYQGESFYRLWQQLSNVSAGIKGHQPTWFYGPSLQHARRWGSKIVHSGVCKS